MYPQINILLSLYYDLKDSVSDNKDFNLQDDLVDKLQIIDDFIRNYSEGCITIPIDKKISTHAISQESFTKFPKLKNIFPPNEAQTYKLLDYDTLKSNENYLVIRKSDTNLTLFILD